MDVAECAVRVWFRCKLVSVCSCHAAGLNPPSAWSFHFGFVFFSSFGTFGAFFSNISSFLLEAHPLVRTVTAFLAPLLTADTARRGVPVSSGVSPGLFAVPFGA